MTTQATQRRRWVPRFLAVLAAFALASSAAAFGGAATPAQAATTYSVSGTLTGTSADGTAVPLDGVFVFLYVKNPSTGYFSYANAGGYTSSTGAYTFTAPAAGTYTLLYNYCSSEGSTSCKPAYVEEYLGHAETSETAATFALTAAAPTAVVNLQVERASTITGTVKNAAGAPIAGARVTANRPTAYTGPAATTNAAGVYTIARASSKNTIVQATFWDPTASNKTRTFYDASYWKNSPTKDAATPLPLTVGSTVSGIDFTLTQPASIRGRAVDSTGKGIANLGFVRYVQLENGQWDGPHSGPNLTDADGWFAVTASPGSNNKVAFFDDLGAESDPGTVTRTVPFGTTFYNNSATMSGATVITAVDHTRTVLSDTVLAPFSGQIIMAGDYHLADEYGAEHEVYAQGMLFSPEDVTTTRQWYRDGVAIAGATDYSYFWVDADRGKALTQKVTAQRPGSSPATFTSTPYQVPAAAGTLTAPTPVLAGSGRVGSPETVTLGAWAPETVTKTYQWYVADVAVAGATTSSFTPPASALGKTLTVKVTGTKPGYTTVSKVSAAVTVAEGRFTAATPTITGKAAVASVLTAKVDTWAPATGTSYSYQWFQRSTVDGTPTAILGATAPSYTVRTTYLGKYLSVTVTAKQAGYTTASASSAPTAKVLPKAVSQ